MGRAEVLRIQVRLCAELHPELHATLRAIGARRRAERLRQLALLGLLGQSRQPPSAALCPADATTPAVDARRARLLGGLTLAD